MTGKARSRHKMRAQLKKEIDMAKIPMKNAPTKPGKGPPKKKGKGC